jgi:hypothetical protein
LVCFLAVVSASSEKPSCLLFITPSPGERLRHHCLAANRKVRGRGLRMRL